MSALAPRLAHFGRDRLLYLFDRPDGTTRVRAMQHVACDALVGDERSFPLDRTRCSSLVTVGGDPLLYGCATACLTLGCGDEWIWVGRAEI